MVKSWGLKDKILDTSGVHVRDSRIITQSSDNLAIWRLPTQGIADGTPCFFLWQNVLVSGHSPECSQNIYLKDGVEISYEVLRSVLWTFYRRKGENK